MKNKILIKFSFSLLLLFGLAACSDPGSTDFESFLDPTSNDAYRQFYRRDFELREEVIEYQNVGQVHLIAHTNKGYVFSNDGSDTNNFALSSKGELITADIKGIYSNAYSVPAEIPRFTFNTIDKFNITVSDPKTGRFIKTIDVKEILDEISIIHLLSPKFQVVEIAGKTYVEFDIIVKQVQSKRIWDLNGEEDAFTYGHFEKHLQIEIGSETVRSVTSRIPSKEDIPPTSKFKIERFSGSTMTRVELNASTLPKKNALLYEAIPELKNYVDGDNQLVIYFLDNDPDIEYAKYFIEEE